MKKFLAILLLSSTYLTTLFVTREIISTGKVAGITSEPQTTLPIQGVVLPHHELAHPLINHLLEIVKQANNKYSTIVLIGPNHTSKPGAFVTTTSFLDKVSLNAEIIAQLTESNPFILDDPVFIATEHSIAVPAKYISQALPGTTIVPLAISPFYHESELNQLIDQLSHTIPGNPLFILSSDFSHNNIYEVAIRYHQTVKNVFATRDYPTLLSLDDNYLDARIPAYIFLKTLENYRSTDWQLVQESHGALLLDQPSLKGTSYITGFFTKTSLTE